MPYTVIYTEAPRCARCGQPMKSWTMFAEVHHHDECWLLEIRDRLEKLFQELRREWEIAARELDKP